MLDGFIREYGTGITCVCFMGGDAEPEYVERLACHLRTLYPNLKIGWYSGRSRISPLISKSFFDYIKIGPYIEHLGCLKSRNTNQRLYKRASGDSFTDITYRFWK